jgi:hypothetical protein
VGDADRVRVRSSPSSRDCVGERLHACRGFAAA